MAEIGAFTIPGTDTAKSAVAVPILLGDEATGVILLENHEAEDAFKEPEVRLLTTLANSMSVALENARLFDETNRLLEETQERAAELAILNSVGEAMSRQLDMETITRLVGDKVRDIFQSEVTSILLFDQKTSMDQHGLQLGPWLRFLPRTLASRSGIKFIHYPIKTAPCVGYLRPGSGIGCFCNPRCEWW